MPTCAVALVIQRYILVCQNDDPEKQIVIAHLASVLYPAMIVFTALISLAEDCRAEEAFGYRVKTDVAYGKGRIRRDGKLVERDLLLDVYTPTGKP